MSVDEPGRERRRKFLELPPEPVRNDMGRRLDRGELGTLTGDTSAVFGSEARRAPPARMGVAVVRDLVMAIVNGEVAPGQTLPPEERLVQHFGVSRTVIRESIKRVEEKGLIVVAAGRGTTVEPTTSWNILDSVVLSVMLENDDALGVLDDLAIIRGSLEGAMSAETARRRSDEELTLIHDAFAVMEETMHDSDLFSKADVDFHFLVMTLSGNQLASNITKILLKRAGDSSRFTGNQPSDSHAITLEEHRHICHAIAAGDAERTQAAMHAHIIDSWQRRRLPTQRNP